MAIDNPQAWSRLTRSRMRQLANLVGNEVMKTMAKWPPSGEGRAVKAATESIARRLDGQQPLRDLKSAFEALMLSTEEIDVILQNAYFRNSLAETPIKRANSRERDTLRAVLEAVVRETREYIKNYFDSLPPPRPPAEIAANEVTELVPEQKRGPLQFAIVDGVVRIHHQAAIPATSDTPNASVARDELIVAGRAASDYLATGNFDHRLNEEVEAIVKRLENQQDVIALGLAAITFQQIVDGFKDELPGFWSAKLQGLSFGIAMYVAQFPDWIRFAENASEAEFDADDIGRLYAAGRKLTEQLRVEQRLVDPEVPRSLAFLLEAVRDPRRAVKRTIFGAVRSIENLIAVIMKAFGSIVSGVPEGLKKGVTAVTASGLLYYAATAAVQIDPAAGRVLRTSWLGKAGKLILDNLKDD